MSRRSRRSRPKPPVSNASASPAVDADGFIVKKTRQQKKNALRPKQPAKPPNSQSPSESNTKSSRNRKRRNRGKQNRAGNNALSSNVSSMRGDDEKETEVDFVIDAIQQCHPRLTNRGILHDVVKQLKLRSFERNDEELQVKILEMYAELKMQQLESTESATVTKEQQARSKQIERSQQNDDEEEEEPDELERDQEEEEEEDVEEEVEEEEEDEYEDEDEQEEDVEDEDEEEEEEEDQHEEEEEEEDVEEEEEEQEEKESSEPAQNKSDTRSMQDDEKKSEAESMSQRDETQRKRARRKRRRKKKSTSQSQSARQPPQQQQAQIDGDDDEDEEQDQSQQHEEHEDMDDDLRSHSSRSKKQKKRRRPKKTSSSLSDKLKSLDLNDIHSASQQINGWLQQLRNDRNQHFFNSFLKAHGVENIVEKVILQLGDQRPLNRGLSLLIIQMFDVMMSGTPDYHEWLFNQFVKLSSDMKKLSSTKSSADGDDDDNEESARDRKAKKKKNEDSKAQLISVICGEARNLVHAQLKNLYNPNNKIAVVLKDMFERPSALLDDGHHDNDPIVPALAALDNELEHVCDLYHDLRTHDSDIRLSCPTSSDAFRSEYNSIKQELQTNIAFIQQRSQNLERKLYSMQSESDNLQREQSQKLSPLKQELQSQENERMHLLSEKRRIEEQLESINQQLSKCDMFIEQTKSHIDEIMSSFKPKSTRLFESVSDFRFEIAGFGQQSDCYSCLLSIVNQSYSLLDQWSRSQLQSDNDERSLVERNYINQLMVYLSKLCKAKKMVIDRVEQLKQHIDAIKRTNDIRAKNYGAHNQANDDEVQKHIDKYRKDIETDEQTNDNISKSIYKHIDKAHKIVSPQLFQQFINHIQQQAMIATYVDLSKYQISQRRQRQQQQQQHKTSVSTQTSTKQQGMQNMNGSHPHSPPHSRAHPRSHPPRSHHHAAAPPPPQQPQPQQQASQQQHRLKPPIVKSQNQDQNQNIPIFKKPPRPHYNQAPAQQAPPQQQQPQQQRRRGPVSYGAHHHQQF